MRLIHTADWHLGRIFHGVHLTEDQAHVLDQLVELARETRPDALLVAGDVYDRAVPPPEAVTLLDEVLFRLVLDLEVPVVLIAGNHDSPDRLGFAARLLAGEGLHVFSSLSDDPGRVTLRGRYGPVHIYALPYAEPAVFRERLDCEEISDHNTAMFAMVDRVRRVHPTGERSILMAHAFVLGGEESESERPLSVGGAGTVGANCFKGLDYVALGHLHRPQGAGDDRIHYSGSLLKYAFSEASHTKSVNLLEMDAKGSCNIERIRLTPRRDVRCIEGTLKEVLKGEQGGESREDYLMVTLLDREPILDAMGKLRSVYPNVLHMERPHLTAFGEVRGNIGDHRALSDAELFGAFFCQVTGEEINEEQAQAYASVVDDLRRRERETEP